MWNDESFKVKKKILKIESEMKIQQYIRLIKVNLWNLWLTLSNCNNLTKKNIKTNCKCKPQVIIFLG
jgi:hypothetical protein